MTKEKLETEKRANLVTMINSLEKDRGGRRAWTDEARKAVIKFYDNRYKNVVVGMVISEHFIENTLKINLVQIWRWKALYKKNGKMRSIVGNKDIANIIPLKTNSIAARGKIVGTTLKNVLGNINKEDIIQQVQMVEILSEAGYDENTLIDHLEIAAPSLEEWKQIKDALKLLSENFDIEVKPKS